MKLVSCLGGCRLRLNVAFGCAIYKFETRKESLDRITETFARIDGSKVSKII